VIAQSFSLVKERARIDELTGEFIRMRREGFVPEPEPPRRMRRTAAGQDVQDASRGERPLRHAPAAATVAGG